MVLLRRVSLPRVLVYRVAKQRHADYPETCAVPNSSAQKQPRHDDALLKDFLEIFL